jgi:hypothetical protein
MLGDVGLQPQQDGHRPPACMEDVFSGQQNHQCSLWEHMEKFEVVPTYRSQWVQAMDGHGRGLQGDLHGRSMGARQEGEARRSLENHIGLCE